MAETETTIAARVLLGVGPEPFPTVARGRIARDGTQEPDRQRYRWTCSVCDRRDAWFDSWQAYTSFLHDEAGEVLFVTCSEDCRKSDRTKLLIALSDGIKAPSWNGGGRTPVGERKIAKARTQLGLNA